jgi:hypothetical protein
MSAFVPSPILSPSWHEIGLSKPEIVTLPKGGQTFFSFYHSIDATNPWHLFHANHKDNTISFPLVSSSEARELIEKFLS